MGAGIGAVRGHLRRDLGRGGGGGGESESEIESGGAAAWHTQYANGLLRFFDSQGPGYGNQYSLQGQPLSKDHSPGLVAMNAVAALAATDGVAWQFVEQFWQTPTPTGHYRYYDGMLYTLGFLQVSGNFRIYTKTSTSTTSL